MVDQWDEYCEELKQKVAELTDANNRFSEKEQHQLSSDTVIREELQEKMRTASRLQKVSTDQKAIIDKHERERVTATDRYDGLLREHEATKAALSKERTDVDVLNGRLRRLQADYDDVKKDAREDFLKAQQLEKERDDARKKLAALMASRTAGTINGENATGVRENHHRRQHTPTASRHNSCDRDAAYRPRTHGEGYEYGPQHNRFPYDSPRDNYNPYDSDSYHRTPRHEQSDRHQYNGRDRPQSHGNPQDDHPRQRSAYTPNTNTSTSMSFKVPDIEKFAGEEGQDYEKWKTTALYKLSTIPGEHHVAYLRRYLDGDAWLACKDIKSGVVDHFFDKLDAIYDAADKDAEA